MLNQLNLVISIIHKSFIKEGCFWGIFEHYIGLLEICNKAANGFYFVWREGKPFWHDIHVSSDFVFGGLAVLGVHASHEFILVVWHVLGCSSE